MGKTRQKIRLWDEHPQHRQWYFYHCDYPRYEYLRPLLRQARQPVDFGSLALNVDSREALEDFVENAMDLFQARQAMVEAQCCLGEPFVAGGEFNKLPAFLKKIPAGETSSILLEDMMFGGLNMRDWNQQPERLTGVLTPQERRGLASGIGIVRNSLPPRRRAGVLRKIVRGLLDVPPPQEVVVAQFHKFLAQAKDEETGLIAFWV